MNPQIGMKFNSYEEITSFMNEYKQTTLSDYWIRDNRTLQSAGKRFLNIFKLYHWIKNYVHFLMYRIFIIRMKKDRFDPLNQNLKYSYVKFSCIHGGQKFREKIKTSNRKTLIKMYKNCSILNFYIYSIRGVSRRSDKWNNIWSNQYF